MYHCLKHERLDAMQLTWADWAVIAVYFAINLAIGFFYMKRASGDTSEFFLSGRNVPWWLAGTSMVATTFGADTPLVVTGLIYNQGIAGNWLWWSFCLSGMLTVFFFAPLWRRARVLTDMEFAELRYSGTAATFLRGFPRRLPRTAGQHHHHGLGQPRHGQNPRPHPRHHPTATSSTAVFACLAITLAYNAVSGLWAVLWTDLVQFILKMSMVVALAVFAVRAVGGMAGLTDKVHASDLARHTDTLSFLSPPSAPASFSPFSSS